MYVVKTVAVGLLDAGLQEYHPQFRYLLLAFTHDHETSRSVLFRKSARALDTMSNKFFTAFVAACTSNDTLFFPTVFHFFPTVFHFFSRPPSLFPHLSNYYSDKTPNLS